MSSRSEGGFTLLEVMIALAIVSITMVTLLGLANRSIDLQGRLQKVTRATLLAQGRMAEVERGTLADGASSGIFSEPDEEFRWQLAYEETPLAAVRMVTVKVLWGDEGANEYVDLVSFVKPGDGL